MKNPFLVGEVNPISDDPEDALYPYPRGCSGWRLCRVVMGLDPETYLDSFRRVNLCDGEWYGPSARERADWLLSRSQHEGRALVLLGAKVRGAFSRTGAVPGIQYRGGVDPTPIILLPHPSGRCRYWNRPGAVEEARRVLRFAFPEIPFGEVSS